MVTGDMCSYLDVRDQNSTESPVEVTGRSEHLTHIVSVVVFVVCHLNNAIRALKEEVP